MDKLVLVLTDKFDVHADKVIDKLLKYNINVFRLDLDVESLRDTIITSKNGIWDIHNKYGNVSSSDIDAIFLRRAFVELLLDEYDITDTGFKIWKGEWNKVLLGLYTNLKDKPWINKLRNSQIAENKFYQHNIAIDCGFILPKQIVSNNITEIESFIHNNGTCVVKALSQEFYREGAEIFKGIYVNKITIDDLKNFSDSENPITIQKYYDKQYEVRYTIIGNEHFVCKIDSQKSKISNVDWRRYDLANTPHLAIIPRDEIKFKVSRLMQMLGLSYGALDFIVTNENEWIFLEINPLGQWLWIEDLTDLDISGGIVRLFMKLLNVGRS